MAKFDFTKNLVDRKIQQSVYNLAFERMSVEMLVMFFIIIR